MMDPENSNLSDVASDEPQEGIFTASTPDNFPSTVPEEIIEEVVEEQPEETGADSVEEPEQAAPSDTQDWNQFAEETLTAQKKSLRRRPFYIAAAAVLGTCAVLLLGAYGVFYHYYSKLHVVDIPDSSGYTVPDESEEEDTMALLSDSDLDGLSAEERAEIEKYIKRANFNDGLVFDDKNITNILLVGTDSRSRGNQNTRADAMIVLSINRSKERIAMISLLRDTYVNVPGRDPAKLNETFAYGGPDLLFKTIYLNYGVPIHKYMHIDFFHFIDLVDAAGGIDLEVSRDELYVMNEYYLCEINHLLGQPQGTDAISYDQAGMVHLNGKQALAYARVRYVGFEDFERTDRHRKVLMQLMEKMKQMSLSELNDFANVALPMISTNLGQKETMALLINTPRFLNDYSVESVRIPMEGTYYYMDSNNISYLGVDFAANRRFWYDTVYGDKE